MFRILRPELLLDAPLDNWLSLSENDARLGSDLK